MSGSRIFIDQLCKWHKTANTSQQGKNLKPILGKNTSIQMGPVVEPNEEFQLDFAGPLPDELYRDAYNLVAIDKWSKFPTAKVVSNTTADIAIKFMQR